jgi:hypothetical protein
MSDEPLARYTRFLETAVQTQRVWTLADERDNPVTGDIDGHRIVPLWTHKQDAEASAAGPWSDRVAIGIHVLDVLEALVPDARETGLLFAVARVSGQGQWVVAPDELERDLRTLLAARPTKG